MTESDETSETAILETTQNQREARERYYTRTHAHTKLSADKKLKMTKWNADRKKYFTVIYILKHFIVINNPSGQVDTRLNRRTWMTWMAKAD